MPPFPHSHSCYCPVIVIAHTPLHLWVHVCVPMCVLLTAPRPLCRWTPTRMDWSPSGSSLPISVFCTKVSPPCDPQWRSWQIHVCLFLRIGTGSCLFSFLRPEFQTWVFLRCVCARVCVYMCGCVCVQVYICTCTYACICMRVCACTCACLLVWMRASICIYFVRDCVIRLFCA